MDHPVATIVEWLVVLTLGALGGFWLKVRADRRDQSRFEKEQLRASQADLRARMEYQPSDQFKQVNIILSNIGDSPARNVTFEVTSIHNQGCHVIWAPVHVPIPVLLPGQEYPLGGEVSTDCPEPLVVELTWTDDVGDKSLEVQITAP